MSPSRIEPSTNAPGVEPAVGVVEPVIKTIRVRANAARAFRIFTDGMGSWWPKTHHIGKSPMVRAVVECHVGGRCYSEQEDGTDCAWGQVTVWEPPSRFAMAWQVRPDWSYEPDPARCSEVEVTFTPVADGSTDVVLVHRCFERHGASGALMGQQVDQPGGWTLILKLFGAEAEKVA